MKFTHNNSLLSDNFYAASRLQNYRKSRRYILDMNPNEVVSECELRNLVPSNIALDWVESLMSRFYGTKENREFIRLKKGITQEILDELFPLGKYSISYYNNPNIFLKFYPGTKTSYDADFVDRDGNLIERVEVTMAIDGQQTRIQAETINQYGYAQVYHTPEYFGTSKNREINEPNGSSIETSKIIEIQSRRIQNAYQKKHKNLHKYPNTTLLIGVDIPVFMRSEHQIIIERFQLLENTFSSIKCVNISSSHCWTLK